MAVPLLNGFEKNLKQLVAEHRRVDQGGAKASSEKHIIKE
jgi:hypothetical protein